jgi:hypothetical protein
MARMPTASISAGVGGIAARSAAANVASISSIRPAVSSNSARSSQWSACPGSRRDRASASSMAAAPVTLPAASSAHSTCRKAQERRADAIDAVLGDLDHRPLAVTVGLSASSAYRRPPRSTTGHSPAGQRTPGRGSAPGALHARRGFVQRQ